MLKLLEKKTDTVRFIASLDAAIDRANSNWSAYRDAGCDESHLTLAGEPTRFEVRPLSQAQQNAAMDLSAGGAAECFRQFEEGRAPLSYMREVCRYAIAGVENPDTDWPKPVMISERGIKMLSREALDRLPDLVCIEIALLSRAMQLQHDGLKKK
jgi:hypothetical protein